MKTKIICLSGVCDCGKSSTLRLVRNILIERFDGKVVSGFGFDRGGDFRILIDVCGIRIGFETQGDPCGRLAKSLRDFSGMQLKIWICACRSSGGTRQSVEAYRAGRELEFILKSRVSPSEREAANLTCAEQIVANVAERFIQASEVAA